MMMSVLSDKEGHYKLENLPPSTYRVATKPIHKQT